MPAQNWKRYWLKKPKVKQVLKDLKEAQFSDAVPAEAIKNLNDEIAQLEKVLAGGKAIVHDRRSAYVKGEMASGGKLQIDPDYEAVPNFPIIIDPGTEAEVKATLDEFIKDNEETMDPDELDAIKNLQPGGETYISVHAGWAKIVRPAEMGKGGATKKLAVLTAEQNGFWEKNFAYYLNDGLSDSRADKLAWQDLQNEFPGLKKYDGIDNAATEKALGNNSFAEGGHLADDPIWHNVGLNRPPAAFTLEAVKAFKEAIAELQKEDHSSDYYKNASAAMTSLVTVIAELLSFKDNQQVKNKMLPAEEVHYLLQKVGIYNYKTGLLLDTDWLNKELATRKLATGGAVDQDTDSVAVLLPYKYHGGIMSAGHLKAGDILYVDKDHKHPDPMKRLLWGWDKDGNDVPGEYARYYERDGRPIHVYYEKPKHATANQEKAAKYDAIREFLQQGNFAKGGSLSDGFTKEEFDNLWEIWSTAADHRKLSFEQCNELLGIIRKYQKEKYAKGGAVENGYTITVEFNKKDKGGVINMIEKTLQVSISDESMFAVGESDIEIYGLTEKEQDILTDKFEKSHIITNYQSQEMMASGGDLNTLSDLKRKLQKGQGLKLVNYFGLTEADPKKPGSSRLGVTRYVVKVQTNGVYLSPDKNATTGSYWEFPPASLVEVSDKGFKVFGIGERPLNEKEKEVIANQPKDAMSDGSTMYYRRKNYFEKSGYGYLYNNEWQKGLYFNSNKNVIMDKSTRGPLELEYEFVDEFAGGGRPKSALMRDRKYQSNEPWEQAYQRSSRPRHPKYKYAGGGQVFHYAEKIAEKIIQHYLPGSEPVEIIHRFSEIGEYSIDTDTAGDGAKIALIEVYFGKKYKEAEEQLSNNYNDFAKFFEELSNKKGFNADILSNDHDETICFRMKALSTHKYAQGGSLKDQTVTISAEKLQQHFKATDTNAGKLLYLQLLKQINNTGKVVNETFGLADIDFGKAGVLKRVPKSILQPLSFSFGGRIPADTEFIESAQWPGLFTIGEDDGEKPLFTREETDLLKDGYQIENEYRAARMDKKQAEEHLAGAKKKNATAKLTHSENEFGGNWRIWVKNTFEKGGSIKNQYAGKTAEQVWGEWNYDQRQHFLLDHGFLKGKANEIFIISAFPSLPDEIQSTVDNHVHFGQYAKGGNVNVPTDFSKVSKKELGKAYAEIVGYDPFVDDPHILKEEVVHMMDSYDEEANRYGDKTFAQYFAKRKFAKGGSLSTLAKDFATHSSKALVVVCKSVGNPDHRQDPDKPISPQNFYAVNTLQEASDKCSEYITEWDLGGGNWAGGDVYDVDGKIIAHVSYNGRVWAKNPFDFTSANGNTEFTGKKLTEKWYASGGRTPRGRSRDRKFKSREPHEQAYKRKTSPKNPVYKKDHSSAKKLLKKLAKRKK